MNVAVVAVTVNNNKFRFVSWVMRNPFCERTEPSQRQSKKHFRTQMKINRKEKQNIEIDSGAAVGQNRNQNPHTWNVITRSAWTYSYIRYCLLLYFSLSINWPDVKIALISKNVLLHQVISEQKSRMYRMPLILHMKCALMSWSMQHIFQTPSTMSIKMNWKRFRPVSGTPNIMNHNKMHSVESLLFWAHVKHPKFSLMM